jgi:SAM-dependent methyltransferase
MIRCLRTGRRSDLQELRDAVRFLYYEMGEQRRQLRLLYADRLKDRSPEQTLESFEYQWREVGQADYMLSNPEYRERVTEVITENTGLPAAWFAGKDVLDAGCGSGRFAYGLAKLGARVTAVDATDGGLHAARQACAEFGGRVTIRRHNLLDPFPDGARFDLVWCFGVLHHTGDTVRAFRNVAEAVKAGGHLFLMIYGEPRLDRSGECATYAEMSRMRRLAANRSSEDTIALIRREHPGEDVHGWFDAIAPAINDLHGYEEIEGWLLKAGFGGIRLTRDNPNHHIIARKTGGRLSSGV